VAAAFVSADLVDEAAVFQSPKPVGADGIDALEGLPLEALTVSPRLTITGREMVGADTLLRFARRIDP
jgi:diaminohydroxyphosphoribosylaminopyrimidine deaminase/5-amino-6-(5-phosphoribosylamino)uracil reductase